MPQVNLNRLYKVRSRERTPVTNPVSVPDAAGAYLRSVRPAQQAQLQSARARAELDNDKWRRIAQGIDTGIRSFEHTYDAYARARERQDADAARKYMTGYDQDYVAHIKDIYGEPRGQTVNADGTITHTGPYTKALEVHNFIVDKRKAEYDALSPRMKEKVDEFLLQRRSTLEESSAKKQAELQQEDIKKTFASAAAVARASVSEYKDPTLTGQGYDYTDWSTHNNEAVDKALELYDFKNGYIDATGGSPDLKTLPEPLKAAREEYANGLRDTMQLERLQQVQQLYVETGNEQYLQELQAWGMTAEEYAAQDKVAAILVPDGTIAIKDDATRAKVREMANEAKSERHAYLKAVDADVTSAQLGNLDLLSRTTDEAEHAAVLATLRGEESKLQLPQSRIAYRAEVDKALQKGNLQLQGLALEAVGEPETRDAYMERLEKRLGEYLEPAQRALLRDNIQKAREDFEIIDFTKLCDKTLKEADTADIGERLATMKTLEEAAKGLKTDKARAYAEQRIMGFDNDTQRMMAKRDSAIAKHLEENEKRRKQDIDALDTYIQLGGREGGFQAQDVVDIMRRYHSLSDRMTPEEATKLGKHLRERITGTGKDIPSAQEVRLVFQWLGWNHDELDTLIGELRDGQFAESPEALILRSAKGGWTVDSRRFGAKDNTGFIKVDVIGGGSQLLGQDDITFILDTIRECKAAAIARNDPGSAFEDIKKRLVDVKEKRRRDLVVKAVRDAAAEAEDAWWMFSDPSQYSTWRPAAGQGGTGVPVSPETRKADGERREAGE